MRTLALVVAALSVAGCAHTEMTGDEHREAAAVAEQKAAVEVSKYDPDAKAHTVASPRPIPEAPDVMREYNPTEQHLAEADRQMKKAFEHLEYADKLERTEELACAGVSPAERTSCPMLAPFVSGVREVSQGVTLYLKPTAPAARLAGQLRCHLAFAKANDFNRAPCPLFIKGVTINLRDGKMIDVFSTDKDAANEVRLKARMMFGAKVEPVAGR